MGKPRQRVKRWTEASVSRTIAYSLFNGRSVLVVPNCCWIGHECDLLVITPDLRIIDVEVKISRADLRADIKKEKWWRRRPWSRRAASPTRREWPEKAWKHYYVCPHEIWTDDLLGAIPEASGVLLLDQDMPRNYRVLRQAKPNKNAARIGPADVIDIARLASLRMWSAIAAKESK